VRAFLDRHAADLRERSAVEERLAREGWVDDATCATLVVGHLTRHGYAWPAVRQLLLEKGLSESVVERALGPASTPAEERARALDVARAAKARTAGTPRPTRRGQGDRDGHATAAERARVMRALARRGFDESVIESVVDELCGCDDA
jgi:SOS response regulatory protein OraA/RecX